MGPIVRFEFLHFTQVNGAPSHPLPGTLKQSYAAGTITTVDNFLVPFGKLQVRFWQINHHYQDLNCLNALKLSLLSQPLYLPPWQVTEARAIQSGLIISFS